MEVACFRRSYSKTQSSDGGGGEGGELNRTREKKKKKKREETGERSSLPFSHPCRTLFFFSSSNFRPRPTILTHGTG